MLGGFVGKFLNVRVLFDQTFLSGFRLGRCSLSGLVYCLANIVNLSSTFMEQNEKSLAVNLES
jgi:hypothetical protein